MGRHEQLRDIHELLFTCLEYCLSFVNLPKDILVAILENLIDGF